MKNNQNKKYKVLVELINAFGASGKEMEVRNIINREIKKYVDKLVIDRLGNLIAIKKGKGPRVMIAAHMDEIGLMVKNIEKDAKVRMSAIGGIDEIILLNEKVEIVTRKTRVKGIITTEEISCSKLVSKIPKMEDLFIDTGLTKNELMDKGVHIGSFISLSKNAEILGNEKLISGKALDDRIGCFILIELIKKIKKIKNEAVFVFTVQEEVGLYGARTSTYFVDPSWAIAVDVIESDDRCASPTKMLGKGPTLTIKDAEMLSSPHIDDKILEVARKKKINLQPDVSDSGTTDALSISLSKGGVPTAVIGVAVRGLHSPISLAHLNDIENAIKLIYEVLNDPPTMDIE